MNHQYILSFGIKHKILDCFEKKIININNTPMYFYDSKLNTDLIKKILDSTINIYPVSKGINGAIIFNSKTAIYEAYIRDTLYDTEIEKFKDYYLIKKIEKNKYIVYLSYKYYNDKYIWLQQLVDEKINTQKNKHYISNYDVIFAKTDIDIIGDKTVDIKIENSHYESYLNYFKSNSNVDELIINTNLGMVRVKRSNYFELLN